MFSDFKTGDIVCTENPMALGRMINFVQKIWSVDNESKYTHSLIIKNSNGDTFEALWFVGSQNIYQKYKNKKIVVYRHEKMTKETFARAFFSIFHHNNQFYPLHKLITNIIPPIGKYLNSDKRLICSELVAKFLYCCKIDGFKHYLGMTPDNISDICANYEGWETVFEGKLS